MFEIVKNIILVILLIVVITLIHELGHLLAAKFFNVYVKEYAIGIGPKLWSKKTKETEISLRAFPIGGFVSLAGDEDNETYSDNKEVLDIPFERTLLGIAKWKRAIIMVAGIVMNMLLALVIYSLIICANGSYSLESKPVISGFNETMPAYNSGLKKGDIISHIEFDNGASISPDDYSEVSIFSSTYYDGNGPWHISVDRDGEILTYDIEPVYYQQEDRYVIGIEFSDTSTKYVKTNIINCWYYGLDYLSFTVKIIVNAFLTMFKGVGLDNLSGPVGIYESVKETVNYGFAYYIQMLALISVNVGVFNAIPLPIMDGGRLLLLLIEAIIGKPIDKKFEEYIMVACSILLLMLMAYITTNDIAKIFGGR